MGHHLECLLKISFRLLKFGLESLKRPVLVLAEAAEDFVQQLVLGDTGILVFLRLGFDGFRGLL